MPDILELRNGFRNRTKCGYQDFYVNGVRLADILKISDFIPPLGWLSSELDVHFRQMFLCNEPSDLRPDRIPTFVCPECVDYGCGVGTFRISRVDNLIIWSDFRWEKDYDEEFHQTEEEKGFIFTFDIEEYRRAIGTPAS